MEQKINKYWKALTMANWRVNVEEFPRYKKETYSKPWKNVLRLVQDYASYIIMVKKCIPYYVLFSQKLYTLHIGMEEVFS
jgi:hypothetical protein